MDLLLGMMNFDATARPSMLDALGSPLFAAMRMQPSDASFSLELPAKCDFEFMKYFKSY